MKEIEPLFKDPVEVVATKPYQLKKIASIRPYKGHTLYEFNLQLGTFKPASFKEVNSDTKGNISKVVISNPNCIYVSALNTKNLIKKLKNIKFNVYT